MDTFSNRLRQAIGQRTHSSVAVDAQIRRSDLLKLLQGTGKRGPCLNTVRALAKATGVNPGWLAFGGQ